MVTKKKKKKKDIKRREIKLTLAALGTGDVHGKSKRKKNIHFFRVLILKIEAPPAVIETGGLKYGLNSISTIFYFLPNRWKRQRRRPSVTNKPRPPPKKKKYRHTLHIMCVCVCPFVD